MLALLCGGQGLVAAEMFALAAEDPRAQPIFADAAALLGADPRALVRGQAGDRIARNRTSQLLSVTAALALFAALEPELAGGFLVTGYSVGEMAAWSIAGVWSPAEALRLTALRAEAMDGASATPGRLAYVRGLGQARVARLAAAHGCAIAIINPGDLFVVGGPDEVMQNFCAQARAEGALRAETLAVHTAAHTQHLGAAVPVFEAALRASDFSSRAPRGFCWRAAMANACSRRRPGSAASPRRSPSRSTGLQPWTAWRSAGWTVFLTLAREMPCNAPPRRISKAFLATRRVHFAAFRG